MMLVYIATDMDTNIATDMVITMENFAPLPEDVVDSDSLVEFNNFIIFSSFPWIVQVQNNSDY